MKNINKIELEYPELRLITEQHKKDFYNALNNKNKDEMQKQCDIIIDKIIKDIRFTGDRFILIMIMNNHILEGLCNFVEFVLKSKI